MMGGIGRYDNDEIQGGTYENAAEGSYRVNGIEWVLDAEHTDPFFREINGEDKIMVRLLRDDEGPAVVGSFTAAELYCLARAFGAKVTVNPKARDKVAGLNAVKDAINNSGKMITVEANADGFATKTYTIPDFHPPESIYRIKFAQAVGLEGTYDFQPSRIAGYPASLLFFFEIVGDANGKPTLYDGFRAPVYMQDVFDHDEMNQQEKGYPDFDPNTSAAARKRWNSFIKYFAPSATPGEYEYTSDPTQSEHGVDEIDNPQYVVIAKALEEEREVACMYGPKPKGKGKQFDLLTLDSMATFNSYDEEEPVEGEANAVITYLMNEHGEDMFTLEGGNYVFTPKGQTWARENLSDPWVKAGLNPDNKKPMYALTETEASNLLAALKGDEAPW